jgi:ribose 5-phosphate isomerase B
MWPVTVPNVRIALGSDERTALTDALAEDLEKRGHELVLVGPPGGEDLGWADVGRRVG